jgi:hypothetical protein
MCKDTTNKVIKLLNVLFVPSGSIGALTLDQGTSNSSEQQLTYLRNKIIFIHFINHSKFNNTYLRIYFSSGLRFILPSLLNKAEQSV